MQATNRGPGSDNNLPRRYLPVRGFQLGQVRPYNLPGIGPAVTRHINCNNLSELFVFVDGACFGNGRPDAKAGYGFHFAPEMDDQTNGVWARLELEGPDGIRYPQTSNRAELRGAIAALQWRDWSDESFNRIVIATDSDYVVKGATDWIRVWLRNGWTTEDGTRVKNQDLWRLLLGEVAAHHEAGLEVTFFKIDRNQNARADRLAKAGAALNEVSRRFAPLRSELD